jgi:hypothetical protein
VAGRARCRMHGGAKSSGGPRGRRNGNYKHGRYTAEAMKRRLQLTQWIKGPIAPDQTLRVYDETIRVLKSAVRNAKLGREEISPQTSKQNQVVISEKPGFTHVSADAYLYVLRSTTRARSARRVHLHGRLKGAAGDRHGGRTGQKLVMCAERCFNTLNPRSSSINALNLFPSGATLCARRKTWRAFQ